jgi:hypothetical protein
MFAHVPAHPSPPPWLQVSHFTVKIYLVNEYTYIVLVYYIQHILVLVRLVFIKYSTVEGLDLISIVIMDVWWEIFETGLASPFVCYNCVADLPGPWAL